MGNGIRMSRREEDLRHLIKPETGMSCRISIARPQECDDKTEHRKMAITIYLIYLAFKRRYFYDFEELFARGADGGKSTSIALLSLRVRGMALTHIAKKF